MRIATWTVTVAATVVAISAAPARAAFDTTLVVAPTSSKTIKAEKPSGAQDYIDHTSIYIRFLPVGSTRRPLPVFISTHNYLTCPENPDKKYYLYDVKDVNSDRRHGVRVLGLFFPKPPCEMATQQFEAITAD